MWEMTTGLREYIQEAGYDVDVDHWKVCEDCNAGATDEILGGEALNLIKDELEAGRPVIMRWDGRGDTRRRTTSPTSCASRSSRCSRTPATT